MIKNSSQNLIKRVLATVLLLAILFCASACGRVQMKFEIINDIYNLNGEEMQYDHGYEWDFGSVDGNQYNEMMTQGDNNFYCMYTGVTNSQSVYDVTDFEQCIYNVEDDTWYADINGILRSAFSNSKDVGTCMGVDSNKARFCPIVGFMAPQDGVYNFKVNNIDLGNTNLKDSDTDGVKLMIYSNRSEIYSEEFSREFQSISFSLNVTLKKNEYIYLIIDPLENGKNDVVESVYLTVGLDTSYTQMYIDNNVAWGFGDLYYTGTDAEQGADGWYYLYGDKNEYGTYDTATFKECELDTTVQEDANHGKFPYHFWLGEDGAQIEHSSGAMSAGALTAAAVALKVPRKGFYAFDIYLDAEAIGNFSVYCGDRRVRVPSFEEGSDGHMSFEAVMEADEMFSFILSEGACQPMIAVRKIENISGFEGAE